MCDNYTGTAWGSVVTQVQPELHDLAHDLWGEAPVIVSEELGHGGEVILRVFTVAAGVSDSYEITYWPVIFIELSAGAQK